MGFHFTNASSLVVNYWLKPVMWYETPPNMKSQLFFFFLTYTMLATMFWVLSSYSVPYGGTLYIITESLKLCQMIIITSVWGNAPPHPTTLCCLPQQILGHFKIRGQNLALPFVSLSSIGSEHLWSGKISPREITLGCVMPHTLCLIVFKFQELFLSWIALKKRKKLQDHDSSSQILLSNAILQ